MKKVLFLLVAAAAAAVGFALWRRRSAAASADVWTDLDAGPSAMWTPESQPVVDTVEPVVADAPAPKATRKRSKAADVPIDQPIDGMDTGVPSP